MSPKWLKLMLSEIWNYEVENLAMYSHQCGSVFAYVTQSIASRILSFWAVKHYLFSWTTLASHPMAQKKNCDKRRQENLPKLPPKKPMVSRWPTVEDVTDSESDESNNDFAPVDSSDDDSEFDMESNDEDNILKEIQTDSELLAFALRLKKAHDQMVINEKALQATKKRKATYLGNSDRSKWRWRAEGKKTEAAGFPSMTKYFQKQSDTENPARNSGILVEVSKSKT